MYVSNVAQLTLSWGVTGGCTTQYNFLFFIILFSFSLSFPFSSFFRFFNLARFYFLLSLFDDWNTCLFLKAHRLIYFHLRWMNGEMPLKEKGKGVPWKCLSFGCYDNHCARRMKSTVLIYMRSYGSYYWLYAALIWCLETIINTVLRYESISHSLSVLLQFVILSYLFWSLLGSLVHTGSVIDCIISRVQPYVLLGGFLWCLEFRLRFFGLITDN